LIVYGGRLYQRYSGGPLTPFEGVIVWRSFGTSGSTPTPTPTPVAQPPGGSGKRYPVGNLDLETWRKKGKRLEVRIEAVQKKIEVKRHRIEEVSYEQANKLKRQIAELQKLLLELLAEMDAVRKAHDEAEMEDVMAAYYAYRSLH